MKTLQKRHLFALAAILLLGIVGFAIAQNNTTPPNTTNNTQSEAGIGGFWEIILPGGKFMCSLNTITSISQHEYVVDGAARVHEITVDTSGSVTARFYYLEPATDSSPLSIGQTAIDRVRELAENATERTGTSEIVWRSVIKNYPTTTHAKTTEFRLQYKENLDRIYAHVHRAWAEPDRQKSYLLRIKDE